MFNVGRFRAANPALSKVSKSRVDVMSFLILLAFIGEWVWVDESYRISMGLDFINGEATGIALLDIDGDGDEDLVGYVGGESHQVEGFENITDEHGDRLWNYTPEFVSGLNLSQEIISLASGDCDGDGNEDLIVRDGSGLHAYVYEEGLWRQDPLIFQDFEGDFPYYVDFADVDADGDMDMLGGWDLYPVEDNPVDLWWNTGTSRYPRWELDNNYFGNDEFHPPCSHFRWLDHNNDGIWDVVCAQHIYDTPSQYLMVLLNSGTSTSPQWENVYIDIIEAPLEIFVINDWNRDGVEDFFLTHDYHHVEAYLYYPGYKTTASDSYNFNHPFLWGNIYSAYPAVADLDDNGVPEIDVIKLEYHWELDGSMWYEYFIPHLRAYSLAGNKGYMWCRGTEREFYELRPPNDSCPYQVNPAHKQYVDFGRDILIDYVLNLDGVNELYRNKGTAEVPLWVRDAEAFTDLPRLFPSLFLDIDGDGDKDALGVPAGDSFLAGFINTGSDKNPNYMRYDVLASGMEELKVSYLAAGDITDNALGLADLAVATQGGALTAFFNNGQANPRWTRHDEVFKPLGVAGNPALCDADQDGDLDLYLVKGGRLCYFRNESTGGIEDKPREEISGLRMTYMGREVEVSLALGGQDEASMSVYNALGQRVMHVRKVPLNGRVVFRVAQPSGVYFCRVTQGKLSLATSFVLLN